MNASANLLKLTTKALAGLRNEEFDRVVEWCRDQSKDSKLSQVERIENVARLFDREFANRLAEVRVAAITNCFAYARLTGMVKS